MADIKAIETQYRGYRFRSRLEARWAVFFDALGIEWEYEKEGYDLGEAGWYLPDFWLPEQETWVEIKPEMTTPRKRVYLAGKILPNGDWRQSLGIYWDDEDLQRWTQLIVAHDEYVGPFWKYIDHNYDYDETVGQSLEQINESDTVFAWVNSDDCRGTLVEIGYARGRGKSIFIGFGNEVEHYSDTYGFVRSTADKYTYAESAKQAYEKLVTPQPDVTAKISALVTQSKMSGFLLYGIPGASDKSACLFTPKGYAVLGYAALAPTDRQVAICPPGHHWIKTKTQTEDAYKRARSARFEFGEQG